MVLHWIFWISSMTFTFDIEIQFKVTANPLPKAVNVKNAQNVKFVQEHFNSHGHF